MAINRRQFLGAGVTAATATRDSPSRPKTHRPKPLYAMGSRRELFVDDFLVERTTGHLSYQLHHPIARERVIQHDAPWENNFSDQFNDTLEAIDGSDIDLVGDGRDRIDANNILD